jgi:tetratricopeptide (TPR) repeat protein
MPRHPRRTRLAPPLAALLIALVALLAAVEAPPLRAQQPAFQWPAKPKNAKALPKDIKPEQLQATMIGFTRALGVRCPHCHVGEEGKPLTTFDFASDAKPEKQIARDMIAMLADVKKDLSRMKLEGTTRVSMECRTCHHGHPRPTTLAEELMVAYEPAGIDSALAAYANLRARYHGRDAFDFGESGLAEFADALAQKGRKEDALRVLERNVEQHPQSLRTLDALARGYEEAGMNDRALATYRKMLEIDPENRNAKRKIEALQGAPK